jgi:hypothetical protein
LNHRVLPALKPPLITKTMRSLWMSMLVSWTMSPARAAGPYWRAASAQMFRS